MHHTRNVNWIGIIASIFSFLTFSLLDTMVKIFSQWYQVIQLSYLLRISVIAVSLLYFGIISLCTKSLRLFKTKNIYSQLIRGMLMFLITLAFTHTFSYLPLSTAYSIIFMLPIVTGLVAIFTVKEHIPWLVWVAIFAGFIGMLLVLRPGIAPWNWGYLSAFLGVCFEAPFFIMTRRYHKDEHPLTSMFYPQFVALLLYVIVFSIFGNIDLRLETNTHIWGLLITAICNILAQASMAYSLTKIDANISTSMQYSQVIWGAALGYLVFREVPTSPFFILGTLIIILSGYVVSTGKLPFVSGRVKG